MEQARGNGGKLPSASVLLQQDHDQRIAAARARRRRVYPEDRRGPLWPGAAAQEQLAVLDRQELIERMDGDEALCNELLRLFAADTPTALERLRQAVAAADGQALQREAHSLKGAAAYVAARVVQRVAEQLELAGRDGGLEHAPALLRRLAHEIDRVCARV